MPRRVRAFKSSKLPRNRTQRYGRSDVNWKLASTTLNRSGGESFATPASTIASSSSGVPKGGSRNALTCAAYVLPVNGSSRPNTIPSAPDFDFTSSQPAEAGARTFMSGPGKSCPGANGSGCRVAQPISTRTLSATAVGGLVRIQLG